MTKIRLRPATAADIGQICHIHAATWQEAYRGLLPDDYLQQIQPARWQPLFHQLLQEGRYHMLVIQAGELVCGSLIYGPAREEERAGEAEITAIYVLPPYWSQGYGYTLMCHALEQLQAAGYRRCYLWVLQGNQRAIRFYEKLGFSANGDVLPGPEAGIDAPELRYVKEL